MASATAIAALLLEQKLNPCSMPALINSFECASATASTLSSDVCCSSASATTRTLSMQMRYSRRAGAQISEILFGSANNTSSALLDGWSNFFDHELVVSRPRTASNVTPQTM